MPTLCRPSAACHSSTTAAASARPTNLN
jgi:hypothetical protein